MKQEASMSKWRRVRLAVAASTLAAVPAIGIVTTSYGQVSAPVKIALPVFLSGPAVGSFGEPSRNAAEVVIEAINNGTLPAPYNAKGLGGSPIEAKIVDEAGSAAVVVTEFRNLVQRDVGKLPSGSSHRRAIESSYRHLCLRYFAAVRRQFL